MNAGSVLLTQGTTVFAQRVARLFPESTLSFASSAPIPQGLLHSGRYFAIPDSGHPAFIHEVLKLALDRETALLLPLGYTETLVLASSKQLFSEYGIEVLVPDTEISGNFIAMENPSRQLELTILHRGFIQGSNVQAYPGGWSGLFSLSEHDSVYQCFAK